MVCIRSYPQQCSCIRACSKKWRKHSLSVLRASHPTRHRNGKRAAQPTAEPLPNSPGQGRSRTTGWGSDWASRHPPVARPRAPPRLFGKHLQGGFRPRSVCRMGQRVDTPYNKRAAGGGCVCFLSASGFTPPRSEECIRSRRPQGWGPRPGSLSQAWVRQAGRPPDAVGEHRTDPRAGGDV